MRACDLKEAVPFVENKASERNDRRLLLVLYGFAQSFLTDLPQCFNHFPPPFLRVYPSIFDAFAPFSFFVFNAQRGQVLW